jgi:hypothetical protein
MTDDLLEPVRRYGHTVLRRDAFTYETTWFTTDGMATRRYWRLFDFLVGRLR